MNEDYAALLNELEFLCREYMGDDNALEAAACIRTIEIIEAIRNEPVPAAVPDDVVAPFLFVAMKGGKVVAADKDDEVIFYWRAGGGQCDEVIALYREPVATVTAAARKGGK